jgi:hypothetical protein
MEAIAAVGSVVALIQLATFTGKLTRCLARFGDDTGIARQEIDIFNTGLTNSVTLIRTAQVAIEQHFDAHKDSNLIQYINSTDIMRGLEKEAKLVLVSMKDARRQVLSMEKHRNLIAALLWTFKKKTVMGIQPGMDCIKASFTLLMQTTSLEATTLKITALPDIPENRVELEKLRERM